MNSTNDSNKEHTKFTLMIALFAAGLFLGMSIDSIINDNDKTPADKQANVLEDDFYHDHVRTVAAVNKCYSWKSNSHFKKGDEVRCLVEFEDGENAALERIVAPGDKVYQKCIIREDLTDECAERLYPIPYYGETHESAGIDLEQLRERQKG